ncbi:MAG: tRNA (cytidine(34)-2'-O)-methyltransferase [Rhodocyclaceae bacterium]
MFHIILFQPEIPPNTGNIMRLCANTGTRLHLIKPLGFELSDKNLTRAGMDYRERMVFTEYDSWEDCCAALPGQRLFMLTTHASVSHVQPVYQPGDVFVFGPESRGLPVALRESVPPEQRLRIPMLPESRSLNLGNSAAVMIYEAWRQQGFAGAAGQGA